MIKEDVSDELFILTLLIFLIAQTVLEKLFSDFVDGLHEGVVTLDHLRIVHCNDAFRRMFDITPEFDVTTLQVNHLVNETSSVALVSALREQVTSGLHQSLELVGIRKRGTLFPVQITLKLLGTKQLIIWRDMTLDKQGLIRSSMPNLTLNIPLEIY
jgi:PAS domain-containing protein